METLCNIIGLLANSINWIICSVILQGMVRHRRMLLALLFLALEATTFALDLIGGAHLGFLVASFVLSIIGFVMTAYSAMRSTTVLEIDRVVIELAFSIVQLIVTYVYLCMSILRVNFTSNIASIFPLVLAVTTLALAYKHNELVEDPTPNNLGRDEEEGFAGTLVPPIPYVVPPDNQSMVDMEEEVEEIPGTSRASLVSSDTPMMSDDKDIAIPTTKWSDSSNEITDSTAAPTTPAISSKTKMFSKLITTTDLEKELIVPNEAMEHFLIPEGQDFVDLLVQDMKGDVWKFCLTIKPTPILTEGWVEFAQANDLVQDEIVTFYKQHNEDFEEIYRVEIDSINK